jgi:selenocysteine lyase/cysteine desulfurase
LAARATGWLRGSGASRQERPRPTAVDTAGYDARMQADSLRLVGQDAQVPLVTGETVRYVNLDYAASAPALQTVADAVAEFLPWYSSVHRGAGYKSRAATAAYEGAREAVRAFFNARPDDSIVFTRNTTDAINLMATALPETTRVIGFAGEHHANLLPWKRCSSTFLPVAASPEELLSRLEEALKGDSAEATLVAITGASNVTGEIVPIGEVAALAHRYGARVVLDAAQLAPHAPIDMQASDIDYLAMSGHKLYAPYGAGVLIGAADWLGGGEPFLRGGGAVKLVTVDEVVWAEMPDRQEAGSPNVIGAVALGVACDTLRAAGMQRVVDHERELWSYAARRFGQVAGFEHYRIWAADHPRVGLFTFNLADYGYDQLAAILSAEYGIGVRHGCFCAHPLMIQLLHVEQAEADSLVGATKRGEHPRLPGAARMSFGLGTTREDVDRAADALASITADGPRWTYRCSTVSGDCEPDPDPRPLPELRLRYATPRRGSEAS